MARLGACTVTQNPAGNDDGTNQPWTTAKWNANGQPTVQVGPNQIGSEELVAADVLSIVAGLLNTMILATVPKNANFTVQLTDRGKLFKVTTGAGDITATLPTAADAGDGFAVWIQKSDSGAGRVLTSISTAPDPIKISGQGQLVLLESDGTNWNVLLQTIFALDVNGRGFTRVQFIPIGGDDATVPALKRNGVVLEIRLGDDTDYTGMKAGDGIFTGRVKNNGYFPLGDISGAVAIDASKQNRFRGKLIGNVTGLTINNMDEGEPLIICLVQDATGNRTVAWTNVTWLNGGAAPVQTATANKRDFYSFEKVDGTIWGAVLPNG